MKTDCKGCDSRDEIIRKLSERIDELEAESDVLELPDATSERLGKQNETTRTVLRD